MAPQDEPLTVTSLDGPGAAAAAADFRRVYADAFAEPPHCETAEDVAAAFARFPDLTRRPGFRATLARTASGEPVGMAYGHPVPPDTPWWDELTEPVPAALRHEDGRRTFGLMELAVRAPWRGRGLAHRLHDTLLTPLTAERVLLNVHPKSEAARAAYHAWGYTRVGQARLGGGPDLYDMMVRPVGGAR
ncbi:GNAT family N-acetyltransferase [Streptomyces sp. SID5785]|uniref:GNAT family N-acetyltransferase n=1 Tax=Streptomyces sp. SID5785 TaxID=2690309 RepID=UPI001361A92E|nr:GNAT family N-acetyltransferase [Streptomyces sp. SID5785]MZD07907.1 GNAT family N-acetyltransferase [Streptomyces sp. SID5785]